MTNSEIVSMLTSFETSHGVPFAYYAFPEKNCPDLPYITYYYPNSANFSADNVVYQRIDDLTIELYTETKDFDLEESLEQVLATHELVWEKSEDWIESENMFMISYEMEIING